LNEAREAIQDPPSLRRTDTTSPRASKPLAESWLGFLTKEIPSSYDGEKSLSIPPVEIPYANMPMRQKTQRASLLLCYSAFKQLQSNESGAQHTAQGSQSSSNGGTQKNTQNANSGSRGEKRSRNVGNNRPRQNGSGDNNSSDDDQYPKRAKRQPQKVYEPLRQFACPYAKRNLEAYQEMPCMSTGYATIARLK
jgi:hypothetical protein